MSLPRSNDADVPSGGGAPGNGATEPAAGEASAMTRRTAVKLGLVGLLGAAAGVGSTAAITRFGRTVGPRYRFFTDAEANLVIAICDQLIPGDDVPGATETGAIYYIDRQLCEVFVDQQPTYRRGLEAFRRTCLQEYRRPFQELAAAEKILALKTIEAGDAPKELWGDPSPQGFFNLILVHTMQSFYGSPRHGGNRDYASYRMLGLDYPPIVGRNHRRIS